MSNKPLRICILENGIAADDLVENFGSYPQMIERWLAPALPEAEFSYLSPVSGDELPDPTHFDGYILSGSKHSTYERAPWMTNLIAFLQHLRQESIPVFGICFGHQIMADAYGGVNAKSAKGWGVGVQQYRGDISGNVYVFHQDQVLKLPPAARTVGHSNHCEYGSLVYSFPAMSVQYHPEFSTDYIQALAEKYSHGLLPDNISTNALRSIAALPVDSTPVASWVADFFRTCSD